MRNYVFLYRTKEADDRDCCAYIAIDDLKAVRICSDRKFTVHGACYSSSLGGGFTNYSYEEIDTILTEEQYNRLVNPTENDDLTDIIETLTSEQANDFFAQIIKSEREYIEEEYDLSQEEIDNIFNEYYLDYCDRAVISYVHRNYEELAQEYLENCYSIPNFLENYINYESFGEDMVNENERYYELDDGRIVELNY